MYKPVKFKCAKIFKIIYLYSFRLYLLAVSFYMRCKVILSRINQIIHPPQQKTFFNVIFHKKNSSLGQNLMQNKLKPRSSSKITIFRPGLFNRLGSCASVPFSSRVLTLARTHSACRLNALHLHRVLIERCAGASEQETLGGALPPNELDLRGKLLS